MEFLTRVFLCFLRSSLATSIFILLVIAIMKLFSKKMHIRMKNALWILILIKLLIPVSDHVDSNLFSILSQKYHTLVQSEQIVTSDYAGNNQPLTNLENNITKEGSENRRNYNFLPAILQTAAFIWLTGVVLLSIFLLITNYNFRRKIGGKTNTADMKTFGSKTLFTLGTALFIMAFPFTTMAATSTINDVSIDIISAGGRDSGDSDLDVVVTTNSDKYHLDKVYDIEEPDGDFKDIDRPTLVVRIKADGTYTFSRRAIKNIKINGTNGSVIGGLMNDTDIKVYIVFDALKDNSSNHSLNVIDLNVNGLKWDKINGTVRWDAVSEADNYQLRLYRGSGMISSFIVKDSNYDLSAYITKEGNYSYQVRAVIDSSLKGTWEKSDVFHVSSEEAARISFGKSKLGLEGPGSRWQYKNDKWYFINESGNMVTGWINWKSKWYYCGDDGAMYTNTTTPDGYKVGSDGTWVE